MRSILSQAWFRLLVAFGPTALAFAWAFTVTSVPSDYVAIDVIAGNAGDVGKELTIRGIAYQPQKTWQKGEKIYYVVQDDTTKKLARVYPKSAELPTFYRTYSVTGKVEKVNADGGYDITMDETQDPIYLYNSIPFIVAGFIGVLSIVAALMLGKRSLSEQELADFESRVLEHVDANGPHFAAGAEPAWGYLTVVTSKLDTDTGRYFVLRENHTVVGRGVDPLRDINLTDPEVSSSHGVIERIDGEVTYRDTDSTNGSWIGGEPVESGQQVPLQNGDLVDCGRNTTLRLELVDASGRARRPAPPKTKKHLFGANVAGGPRRTERLRDDQDNAG